MRAAQAQAIARDLAIAAEWALHDGMLGAKAQVIAQYGPDAHAVQLLGLKRKSERRRPVRRAAVATTKQAESFFPKRFLPTSRPNRAKHLRVALLAEFIEGFPIRPEFLMPGHR